MASTVITDTIKMPEFDRLSNPIGDELLIAISNNIEVKILLDDLVTMFNLKAAAPIPIHINDADIFDDGIFVPVEPGTYTFLSPPLIYDPAEGLTFFVKSNEVWTKSVTPIDFTPTGQVIENDPDAVSGGEVYDKVPTKPLIGIKTINAGDNLVSELTSSNINNNDLWEDGYIHKTTGALTAAADFRSSKKTYFVAENASFNYQFVIRNNAAVVFFDKNGVVLGSITNPIIDATGSNLITNGTYITPVGTIGFKVSHHRNSGTNSIHFIANATEQVITSDVFLRSSEADYVITEKIEQNNTILNAEITNTFEGFDLEKIPANQNLYSILQNSNLDDTSIWGNGFLRANGNITPDANWRHTDYLPIVPGNYESNLYCAGNSVFWVCDINKNITQVLSTKGVATGSVNWALNISENEVFIRVSKSKVTNFNAYVRSPIDIYYNGILAESKKYTNDNIKGLNKTITTTTSTVKRVRPIVTFISDDGSLQNEWFINALNEHNFKATFAIITGRFSLPGFMNKDQVIQLLNDGHEIAGHTVSHDVNAQLATLNEDQLHAEIGNCKFALQTLDNRISATNFVSPFGSRNLNVDLVVRQYFESNYVTRADSDVDAGTAINKPVLDNFNLRRVSFDASGGALNVSRLAFAKHAVDVAVSNGGWLVFAIHPHYPQYIDPANTVDSKQELRDLLTYISSLNIPVMTAEQAKKFYANYSIGNMRLDASYYEVGIDGTTSGNLL